MFDLKRWTCCYPCGVEGAAILFEALYLYLATSSSSTLACCKNASGYYCLRGTVVKIANFILFCVRFILKICVFIIECDKGPGLSFSDHGSSQNNTFVAGGSIFFPFRQDTAKSNVSHACREC